MKTRQHGVAIVLAMGVVALAALLATAMMMTQTNWARHNELTADHVQAQTLLNAGVDWARALLSDDRRSSNVDHTGEVWALRLPPMPVDNGELAGHIDDQQGAFNVNNLIKGGRVNPSQFAHFQRLLMLLELPPTLADALADWIDADSEPQSQYGAEDTYYLARQSPYLAANRPLIDLAELALIRGFDEGIRARLRPFVSALPTFTAININTAPAEVIAAVIDGLDLDAARTLVGQRQHAYFRDKTDFLSRLPDDASAATDDICFGSDFFLVNMRISIGSAQTSGTALLSRPDTRWPTIVWKKMS